MLLVTEKYHNLHFVEVLNVLLRNGGTEFSEVRRDLAAILASPSGELDEVTIFTA
jgi:hypothetical protein